MVIKYPSFLILRLVPYVFGTVLLISAESTPSSAQTGWGDPREVLPGLEEGLEDVSTLEEAAERAKRIQRELEDQERISETEDILWLIDYRRQEWERLHTRLDEEMNDEIARAERDAMIRNAVRYLKLAARIVEYADMVNQWQKKKTQPQTNEKVKTPTDNFEKELELVEKALELVDNYENDTGEFSDETSSELLEPIVVAEISMKKHESGEVESPLIDPLDMIILPRFAVQALKKGGAVAASKILEKAPVVTIQKGKVVAQKSLGKINRKSFDELYKTLVLQSETKKKAGITLVMASRQLGSSHSKIVKKIEDLIPSGKGKFYKTGSDKIRTMQLRGLTKLDDLKLIGEGFVCKGKVSGCFYEIEKLKSGGLALINRKSQRRFRIAPDPKTSKIKANAELMPSVKETGQVGGHTVAKDKNLHISQ